MDLDLNKLRNVSEHQARLEIISKLFAPEKVGQIYVGDSPEGNPKECGLIIRHLLGERIVGASMVDIGCGIGRLTQFLVH